MFVGGLCVVLWGGCVLCLWVVCVLAGWLVVCGYVGGVLCGVMCWRGGWWALSRCGVLGWVSSKHMVSWRADLMTSAGCMPEFPAQAFGFCFTKRTGEIKFLEPADQGKTHSGEGYPS